jgi:diacylglycerol kinase (ATP)
MQANLILNPNSGLFSGADREELEQALQQAGYEPVYSATNSEDDLDPIIARAEGLLVVAGGDGSVRSVVTRNLERRLPLAILPMGTANNIARFFGINGKPQEIIAGLREPEKAFLDVGKVTAPWGVDYFLETFGIGMWAHALKVYQPEMGRSLARTIASGMQTLNEYVPIQPRMLLDGSQISGEFTLVEALNTNAFGPRIKAAPEADPADGLFDLVLLHSDQRESLISYILAMLNEELSQMPGFELLRGRELRIEWTGFPIHVDAEVRPRPFDLPFNRSANREAVMEMERREDGEIVVEMLHRAAELWLPQPVREDPSVLSFEVTESEDLYIDRMRALNHDLPAGPTGIR